MQKKPQQYHKKMKRNKSAKSQSFQSATSFLITTAHIASFDMSIYSLLHPLSSAALHGFDPQHAVLLYNNVETGVFSNMQRKFSCCSAWLQIHVSICIFTRFFQAWWGKMLSSQKTKAGSQATQSSNYSKQEGSGRALNKLKSFRVLLCCTTAALSSCMGATLAPGKKSSHRRKGSTCGLDKPPQAADVNIDMSASNKRCRFRGCVKDFV